MLSPREFDEKIKTLREINERIKRYSSSTPIEKVNRDYEHATALYHEIEETLQELQGERE